MAHHVDFVQNDWAGAVQRLVGRVTCEHGVLHVKDVAPHFDAVVGNLVNQVNEAHVDAPLREIANRGAGSYLTTAGPHSKSECPFADSNDVAMLDLKVDGLLIP